MAAIIPESVKESKESLRMLEMGFRRINQGKTRDVYEFSDFLLFFASDRLSIFDFVLPVLVPKKGEVLTALSHFWFTKILDDFPNHLRSSHKHKDCNSVHDLLHKYPDLPIENCLVSYKVNIVPAELIFRHHIGGSVYKKYLKTGKAGGHKLPLNLPKWSKLDKPIFTPSTKEEVGHDLNYDAHEFYRLFGKRGHELVAMISNLYARAYAYAEKRGILILDSKFEASFDCIADEVLTPDSSRFCDKEDWEKAMVEGRDPQFKDKEPVRIFGKSVETPFTKNGEQLIGINNLDPINPEHIAFVSSLKFPDILIKETTNRYLDIFFRLTGKTLKEYQTEDMKIMV